MCSRSQSGITCECNSAHGFERQGDVCGCIASKQLALGPMGTCECTAEKTTMVWNGIACVTSKLYTFLIEVVAYYIY